MAARKRIVAGTHAREAHEGVEDTIGLGKAGKGVHSLAAERDLAASRQCVGGKRRPEGLLGKGDVTDSGELAGKTHKLVGTRSGCHGDKLDFVRIATHNVDRLTADGARRTEKNDLKRAWTVKDLAWGGNDTASARLCIEAHLDDPHQREDEICRDGDEQHGVGAVE